MNGILNIGKPKGPTSFSVVSLVRRVTGIKKVGHAGTLDPAASGILPVCLGRAARVSEYLMEYPKTYRVEVELGRTTDTYDSEGETTSECTPPLIRQPELESALSRFTGEILQKPPVYSALKIQGRPLYKFARAGQEVEIKERLVSIYRITIIDITPPCFTLDVECGRGTYIRSLAHDIGREFGCGAYMKNLVRTAYGPFGVGEAVELADFKQAAQDGNWQKYLYPSDVVLKHLEAFTVPDDLMIPIKNGRLLNEDDVTILHEPVTDIPHRHPSDPRRRVYTSSGTFLGIYTLDPETGVYTPVKILM